MQKRHLGAGHGRELIDLAAKFRSWSLEGKKNNPVSSDITWERSQGLGFRVSEGEIVLYTRVHLVEKILDVSTVAFCLFVVNTV